MKILVLGGCGFIGSHVCDALIADGHSLRVFDRQYEHFRKPLPNVEYKLGDFRDSAQILEALSGVDAVVHLVSTTFPGTADLNPKADVSDNLVSTISLLDSMVSLGISRLLFLSSGGTVYGPPQCLPIPEDHPLKPINSYGIVKTAIESFIQMYGANRGISQVIIRASNPYGPRQGHAGVQGVIGTFMRRSMLGESIEIWGDGSVVRDYIHATDIARLCSVALTSDRVGVYNGGCGAGLSLRDVVDAISTVTGKKLDPVYTPKRAVDVPVSVLDSSAAYRDFGWSAKLSLADGLVDTWEWMSRDSGSGT